MKSITDASPDDTTTRGAGHPSGPRARRALILRRAANRTSRRILRSLNAEVRRPTDMKVSSTGDEFEKVGLERSGEPLARPVQPARALDDERNRWGGRL